jgi:hypothetical protein
MNKFLYFTQESASPVEITEDEILAEYWEFWKEKMIKKYGFNHYLQTHENCIDDWCIVNWAWKAKSK